MQFIKLPKKGDDRGFTLIEILVVIGIIAVLAAIVLVAINPARQFAQARDTQRQSNVTAVLDAVGQFIADNQGAIPDGITGTVAEIDDTLCGELVPTYLPAMPTDPTSNNEGADVACADTSATDDVVYNIVEDGNGRITVCSPTDEDTIPRTDDLCVTR